MVISWYAALRSNSSSQDQVKSRIKAMERKKACCILHVAFCILHVAVLRLNSDDRLRADWIFRKIFITIK
jgi:hypothetical protein